MVDRYLAPLVSSIEKTKVEVSDVAFFQRSLNRITVWSEDHIPAEFIGKSSGYAEQKKKVLIDCLYEKSLEILKQTRPYQDLRSPVLRLILKSPDLVENNKDLLEMEDRIIRLILRTSSAQKQLYFDVFNFLFSNEESDAKLAKMINEIYSNDRLSIQEIHHKINHFEYSTESLSSFMDRLYSYLTEQN